ncbi:MAG: CPBP family intramembrane metalloprotease [Bryobacterales bacterium]|nr:CPBP family intramembrane metalloprotease [Bryobacterales bacterium]
MPRERMARIVGLALRVGVYVFLAFVGLYLFGWALSPTGSFLLEAALGGFLAATAANALAMRFFERAHLTGIGLGWNRASVRNLLLGLAGGAGAAALVLGGPLVCGLARLQPAPGADPHLRSFLFVLVVLLFGAIGEEMLFRGYAFQSLVAGVGPAATILPMGVLFGLMHAANLGITTIGIVNTSLWGILLGYAFVRSGDLWLPIGLHLGWNWMLPAFGVNLSGFTMDVTGYAIHWKIGPLWSGGAYGPEGGLLTSGVVVVLAVYLWKAPVRTQAAYLLGGAGED